MVTDNDPARARDLAERLSHRLWEARERLIVDLPGPTEAVRRATSPPALPLRGEGSPQTAFRPSGSLPLRGEGLGERSHPIVLVDMGDNIGGGSAGDATFLLAELVRQKASGWVAVIADPAGVKELFLLWLDRREAENPDRKLIKALRARKLSP